MHAAEHPAQASTTEVNVFVALIDLLDNLRHATSLADVNLAAGVAWQSLADAERTIVALGDALPF